MLAFGIVQPNNSPFASPLLLVRKKNQSCRFCVDYRELNKATIQNKYPIPVLQELLDESYGAQFFSIQHQSSAKLAHKYYGPFKILQKISPLVHKLQLPLGSKMHLVFHISLEKIGGFPSCLTWIATTLLLCWAVFYSKANCSGSWLKPQYLSPPSGVSVVSKPSYQW